MLKKISRCWYTLKAALVLAYIFLGRERILYGIRVLTKNQSNRHKVDSKNKEAIREKKKQQREQYPIEKKERKGKDERLKKVKQKQPNPLKIYFMTYIYLVGYLADCIKFKCITARILSYGNLGVALFDLVAIAWICEKLNLDLKPISKNTGYYDIFDSTLNRSDSCKHENFMSLKEPITHIRHIQKHRLNFREVLSGFARHRITSEYGYKIISKLSIKQDLQQQADNWCRTNIKGNCIGVHYRGTDAIYQRKMTIEAYITYLKKVLDADGYIFACSEEERFITRMKATFPGRVVARNIKRSQTNEAIHFGYDPQQIQNAFIDLLILSKTELVYTVGSNFSEFVRFLNPSIKMISLEFQNKNISNYLPIPERHFVERTKKEYENAENRTA